jgi:hypothetical protein
VPTNTFNDENFFVTKDANGGGWVCCAYRHQGLVDNMDVFITVAAPATASEGGCYGPMSTKLIGYSGWNRN